MTEESFTCNSGAVMYIHVGFLAPKMFQRYFPTRKHLRGVCSFESWLVNHNPWNCECVDCQQILLSLKPTLGFFLFMIFKQKLVTNITCNKIRTPSKVDVRYCVNKAIVIFPSVDAAEKHQFCNKCFPDWLITAPVPDYFVVHLWGVGCARASNNASGKQLRNKLKYNWKHNYTQCSSIFSWRKQYDNFKVN